MSLLALLLPLAYGAPESWVLDHSTVTYTVHHPLKTASGTSKDAKGKGVCEKGHCDFLVAAPLKSFDSGDSNRDLHMLEATRGGENPMVVVRTTIEETAHRVSGTMPLTFKIQFAGKEATYSRVPFEVQSGGDAMTHVKGTIPIKLSDFSITPPSLLTFPIKDEVPIEIDAFWKRGQK
jgi:hypothetical protein